MTIIFNKPLEEIVKARYSVRNYENKPLSDDTIRGIEDYINNLDNPFNIDIKIKLIKKESLDKNIKLGTYGVIKGANYYLVSACEKKEFAFEALGYALEKVILYCTSLGLGTVWLGGTFNRGDFAKAINLKGNEVLPIVSPVGYEGGKKSFLSKLMTGNSSKRKDYSELFFSEDFNNPLNKDLDKEYGEAFEIVRLAPSAMNKQPWRMVKANDDVHIYTSGKIEMSKVDIGIAMCHLDLYMKEKGISGEFKFINPNLESKFKYVVSWIRNN